MTSFFFLCSISIFHSLVSAQSQFSQPNGSLVDLSQTFVNGDSYRIQWRAGWRGYGSAPTFVDLFLCSWNSDAYLETLIPNVSLSSSNMFNWRVNIPEDVVNAEKNFAFKFVTAQDPPNYFQAQPAKVMSPSRGFKVVLKDAASVMATRTQIASSNTLKSPTGSETATFTSAAGSTPSSSSTGAAANINNDSGSGTPVGAIVGGIVGSLAVIALGVIALLLWRRSQQKKVQQAMVHNDGLNHTPAEMGDTRHKTPVMYPTLPALNHAHVDIGAHELPGNCLPVEADNNCHR